VVNWAALAPPDSCRDHAIAASNGENAMSMRIGMLDHYNVSTRKLGDTVRFYEEVLGFKNGARPAFDVPGAWVYSDAHAVLNRNDYWPTDQG
jgi:hypothetical protein